MPRLPLKKRIIAELNQQKKQVQLLSVAEFYLKNKVHIKKTNSKQERFNQLVFLLNHCMHFRLYIKKWIKRAFILRSDLRKYSCKSIITAIFKKIASDPHTYDLIMVRVHLN